MSTVAKLLARKERLLAQLESDPRPKGCVPDQWFQPFLQVGRETECL